MKYNENYIEDAQIINISDIKGIKFDTEIPVSLGYHNTNRSLCANSFNNSNILDRLDALFDSSTVKECNSDLFNKGYITFENIEELKTALSELLIRFDTDPNNYTKGDYAYLMMILYKSLMYFYDQYRMTISVNGHEVLKENGNVNIQIGTNDPEHLEVTTAENGVVNIKANVGEMETPSTKIATINDIRNYITNKLSWQTYG